MKGRGRSRGKENSLVHVCKQTNRDGGKNFVFVVRKFLARARYPFSISNEDDKMEAEGGGKIEKSRF